MDDLNRETLRAELSMLELRLVDRITEALSQKADRTVVIQHDIRIADLEKSRAAREHLQPDYMLLDQRVGKLERWRAALPSAAVLSAVAAIATTVIAVFHL